MRLVTLYTLYGRRAGAEMLTERTLEEIRRLAPDWRITVFCNAEARTALAERALDLDVRYVRWLDDQVRKTLWLEFVAPRLMRRDRFDVCWLPSGGASFPGRWEVPTVVTFLDMGAFLMSRRFDFVRTVYRRYISTPRSVRRATASTAISKATAEDVVRFFPGIRMPTVVYPGPSPLPPSAPPPEPATLIARETGLKVDRIFFAPARTDYYGKARDVLLRAYADYRRRAAQPLPLVLPGPRGMFHELMMRDLRRLGLQGHAHWPGRVSNECMEAFYSLSEALILPSRTEGFGFPVLEAMQRGVPVICSDAGSLPEVAGDAALIVPTGNAAALTEAMLRLEREPDLRAALGRKGRTRAQAFSWERTALQYIALFRQLAAEGRRS